VPLEQNLLNGLSAAGRDELGAVDDRDLVLRVIST